MLALLFLLFYADTSFISEKLNIWQSQTTLALLKLGLDHGQVRGNDIIISPHYKLIVTQACNGMIPILFYLASVIAYPSTFNHKVIWGVLGYIVISVVNVLRILFVAHMVKGGREHFELAHDIIGNMILMVVGLTLFIFFIKRGRKNRIRHTSY
jgi:exosortase/archaeosortase family protein